MLSSCLVSAVSQNSQTDDSQKPFKPLGFRDKIFRRCWAAGNATSGKLIGDFSQIGKVEFSYIKFEKLRFFPMRWEIADFINAKVLLIGLDQEIPEGPFDLEREFFLVAIVLKY